MAFLICVLFFPVLAFLFSTLSSFFPFRSWNLACFFLLPASDVGAGIDHCLTPTCSTCPPCSFFMSFKYHVRVAQSKRSPLSTHVSTILAIIILDSWDPLSSSLTLAHRPPALLILCLMSSSGPIQHPNMQIFSLSACPNTRFSSLSGCAFCSKRAISTVILLTSVSSSYLLPMLSYHQQRAIDWF